MQTRVDESQNYDVALKKLDPPQKKKQNKKIHSFHLHEIPENNLCDTKSVVAQGSRIEEQNSLQKWEGNREHFHTDVWENF